MKLGCCSDIRHASVIQKAGFDFLECTVVSLVPENDAEFDGIYKKYQESQLPVETCNIFLPSNLKVVGETVDEESIKRYLEKALPRVKQIGADTIVFGSGGARSLPEGLSREKGEEQIVQFLNLAADHAEPLGLTIVIEPLNKKESNIINTVPEAVQFAKEVNRESVQVLADFYHMEEDNEPLENIIAAKEFIKHIHVADTGRLAPGTGEYPYHVFKDCLKHANYDGRISIECKWNQFEKEVSQTREFLADTFDVS